jgi:hypothetical protein
MSAALFFEGYSCPSCHWSRATRSHYISAAWIALAPYTRRRVAYKQVVLDYQGLWWARATYSSGECQLICHFWPPSTLLIRHSNMRCTMVACSSGSNLSIRWVRSEVVVDQSVQNAVEHPERPDRSDRAAHFRTHNSVTAKLLISNYMLWFGCRLLRNVRICA